MNRWFREISEALIEAGFTVESIDTARRHPHFNLSQNGQRRFVAVSFTGKGGDNRTIRNILRDAKAAFNRPDRSPALR